jgi:hypothetical protein
MTRQRGNLFHFSNSLWGTPPKAISNKVLFIPIIEFFYFFRMTLKDDIFQAIQNNGIYKTMIDQNITRIWSELKYSDDVDVFYSAKKKELLDRIQRTTIGQYWMQYDCPDLLTNEHFAEFVKVKRPFTIDEITTLYINVLLLDDLKNIVYHKNKRNKLRYDDYDSENISKVYVFCNKDVFDISFLEFVEAVTFADFGYIYNKVGTSKARLKYVVYVLRNCVNSVTWCRDAASSMDSTPSKLSGVNAEENWKKRLQKVIKTIDL